MFANCSKNQNKVLKCIFKSSWVLGFAKYWGLCKKKNPPRVGKYKNFEMHNLQSPHISPGSPPGEADDKCISADRGYQSIGDVFSTHDLTSLGNPPQGNPPQAIDKSWIVFCPLFIIKTRHYYISNNKQNDNIWILQQGIYSSAEAATSESPSCSELSSFLRGISLWHHLLPASFSSLC